MILQRWPLLRDRRAAQLAALLIAGIGMLSTVRFAWWRIEVVRGWEADAIARAIVDGHGYSFPGTSRWLWEMWKGNPNEYFPTAWVDPVYTYTLAAAHFLFGSHAYWAIYALNFLCLGIILICAFRITERFAGPWSGVIAVALIAGNAALGRSFFDDITNSALASCALTVLALAAVRYFELPSRNRLAIVGLATGATILVCPAVEYFMLFIAVALAVFHLGDGRAAALRPLAAIVLAAIVIAPWTIRNYAAFGEFVLVRNGGGQIAWDSTVGTAATFMSGAAQSPLPAPWQSTGPHDAVNKMLNKDMRIAIHHYQTDSVMASPPPGYDTMNEAQRDQFFMQRTLEFISQNVAVTTQMALSKAAVFLTKFGPLGVIVAALALLGSAVVLHDARSWPLTLLALSYCAPFVLIIAYYGRYRAPIEPILAVLAALGINFIFRRLTPAAFTQP